MTLTHHSCYNMCYICILRSSQSTSIAWCRPSTQLKWEQPEFFLYGFQTQNQEEWAIAKMKKIYTAVAATHVFHHMENISWLQERRMKPGKENGEGGWPPYNPDNTCYPPSLSPSSSFASSRMLPRSFWLPFSLLKPIWIKFLWLVTRRVMTTVSLSENEFLKLSPHRLLQMKTKPQAPECICFQEGVSGN